MNSSNMILLTYDKLPEILRVNDIHAKWLETFKPVVLHQSGRNWCPRGSVQSRLEMGADAPSHEN